MASSLRLYTTGGGELGDDYAFIPTHNVRYSFEQSQGLKAYRPNQSPNDSTQSKQGQPVSRQFQQTLNQLILVRRWSTRDLGWKLQPSQRPLCGQGSSHCVYARPSGLRNALSRNSNLECGYGSAPSLLPAGATRFWRTCHAICLRATASRSARAPHSTCALHIAPRRKVGRLLVASEPKLGQRRFGIGRK